MHCIPSMQGGGAERQLAYLAHGLSAAGWDVHVALGAEGPNFARLQSSGATVHRLRRAKESHRDPRMFMRMLNLMRRLRPDAVQVWLPQMEILGGLAALATGTPWVFSERCSEGAYPPNMRTRVRQSMARLATVIVSNSASGDQYWQARVGEGVKRYVIPNAIPVEEIAAAAPARSDHLGLRPDVPLVLFAGRFEEQKNLGRLLPALERVIARHDIQVLCCGEGPLRVQCTKWIAEHGLTDRIRLSGYQPNLWNIMKLATVFVSPSLFEGSPNVVLEAMASGCPLVLSDIPAHRELVDERSAVLVDPRLPESIADGLEQGLSNAAARTDRARVARAAAERYTVRTIADKYMHVYQQILSASLSPPVKVTR